MSKLINPLTDKENEALKASIFVTTNSHLKIVCKCPECGADFFYWIEDGLAMDLETVKMHMETTDCTRCAEEWADRDEDEDEEEEQRYAAGRPHEHN